MAAKAVMAVAVRSDHASSRGRKDGADLSGTLSGGPSSVKRRATSSGGGLASGPRPSAVGEEDEDAPRGFLVTLDTFERQAIPRAALLGECRSVSDFEKFVLPFQLCSSWNTACIVLGCGNLMDTDQQPNSFTGLIELAKAPTALFVCPQFFSCDDNTVGWRHL